MTLTVGSTAFNPFGWSIHFESRKKFCMSTITRAVVSGEIVIDVSFGPSVVATISFFGAPPERSYVLVDRV